LKAQTSITDNHERLLEIKQRQKEEEAVYIEDTERLLLKLNAQSGTIFGEQK
jgi:hypothetical protein